MKFEEHTVVGLGELIWDLLPDGKQLGGAPTNFAYICRLLGNTSITASRTGADELGREARVRLNRLGISTDYLQQDEEHPTGTVGVRVDDKGEAHFSVNENSAWDYLEWTAEWKGLAARADAVCFGTLGQRVARARATIKSFLQATGLNTVRLFDVNLRHSFFTPELLRDSLALATIVKLNREELSLVASMLELDERGERAIARRLILGFDLDIVAVTRGARGSLLVSAEEVVEHDGFRVAVADTIGAGDAFAAALAHFYLRRAPLKQISEAANRTGAWVATQVGATPQVDARVFEQMLSDIV